MAISRTLNQHNLGSSDWTFERSVEKSQYGRFFQLKSIGHLRLWPSFQSDQSLKFAIKVLMVLY